MVPSKRFKPVHRVAESRENKAARALGESQRKMREHTGRLEELKQYHCEYLERFRNASREGLSVPQMQEYRAFLMKLETAIRDQEKVLQMSRRECTGKKDAWQEKHIRTQALGKAMDRFRKAENKVEVSREQQATDEHNQWRGKDT